MLRTFRSRFGASTSANADVSAIAGADYDHVSLSGGNGSADGFDAGGAVAIPLGWSGLNVQGQGGYSYLSHVLGPYSANQLNIGGTVYWADPTWRIGGVYNYIANNAIGSTFKLNEYGGAAEFFFAPEITLAANGGGFSGNFHVSGWYVGGHATGYIMPDLGITGAVEYTDATTLGAPGSTGTEVDLTAQGEWLVSEEIPVSVFGGYTYSSLNSGFGLGSNGNTFFVGLKLRLNESGAGDLVDRDRSGPMINTTPVNAIAFKF
ncbi:MAG: hypothetical protein JOZ55_03040 [Alphaproteobacteria bacterium]|nr:hypothetical protein [Alphaproteobacteria bacterium]